MAWVKQRGNAYTVRWRDEDARVHTRTFAWGQPKVFEDAVVTQEEARVAAEAFRRDVTATERKLKRTYAQMDVLDRQFGYVDWKRPDRSTLSAYLRHIIESDRDLRDTTRELYLRNLRLHIDGTALGNTDVRDIEPEHLTEWWSSLSIGVGARRNVQQLVAKALNRAVQEGVIDVSPLKRAPSVKRPPRNQQDVLPLTVTEIEMLADAATNTRDRLEILVMAYGGLRAGEVGGLRKQDVSPGKLTIRQQVVRTRENGMYVAPLKTRAAMRTVHIPASVSDELTAFAADKTDRVFTGPNGEMRAHTAINHSVKVAAKRAGLSVHAHALRHTAVSLLIEAGANPRSVQAMVGHSDVRMTLQTYGHLFGHEGPELAQKLEDARSANRR